MSVETKAPISKHDILSMRPEQREQLHKEAESRIQPFAFVRPEAVSAKGKTYYKLARTDLVNASVQIVPEGGENNLHYHSGEDGFWMVLQGRVRFYGPDGPIGEFGANEGVLMPRHARYWFETVDPNVELHILHIAGREPRNFQRIDIAPKTEQFKHTMHVDPSDVAASNKV